MSSPPAADDRAAPRDPLSRDRVVAAAIAVLDAEGFGALSMRRVARELDTGAMSLYRHIADRDELLDLVLEELAAEVVIPEATGNWREDIAAIARAVRGALLRRRDLTLLLTARLGRGRAALPVLDRTIGVFLGAGFSARDAVHANHALGNYVSGAAMWEAVGLNGEVEPSRREARAAESAARLAELPAGTVPNLVAVAGELFAGSGDERFEYGLAVLIDGFAARPAKAHEPAPPGHGAA